MLEIIYVKNWKELKSLKRKINIISPHEFLKGVFLSFKNVNLVFK